MTTHLKRTICAVLLTVATFFGCTSQRTETGRGSGLQAMVPHRQSGYVNLNASLPGSLGNSNFAADELWVIGRQPKQLRQSVSAAAQSTGDDLPGSGALVTILPGESKKIPVPLKHTDVRASISGYIATVDVKQQYHNPFSAKIEAVYVFPLPDDAAVTEFVMSIGDRHIRGIIRERAEAEKIYAEAKSQGYVASLMTQERPNIFTQSVANIEPGKAIDIDIKYFHTLPYDDGWYEFVFPMVVGPRFNPGGSSDKRTAIQYLTPSERSGHDISLTATIDAGVTIEDIACRNHSIESKDVSPTCKQVAIKSSDSIPNKDFVLRYKVAGARVKTAMFAQRDAKNPDGAGYFTLMIFPPDLLKDLPRKPLEMVYTIDVSGSMSGRPMEQALAATRYALQHMQRGDSFQIVSFANTASQMSKSPLPATPENISRGLHHLENLREGGGTMMLEGMRKSLDFPHDPERLRFITFLTDGFIGNEMEILRAMYGWLGDSRVFSVGVGSSTNRYLLNSMAQLGNGSATYLALDQDATEMMADHFARISHPALTNLAIDFGEMKASEIYPSKLPDLFVGRPITLTGRFHATRDTVVKVIGKVGRETRTFEVPIALHDLDASHAGISSVWARRKIVDIGDRTIYEPESVADATQHIKQVALEHGLISAYTAFIAVDSSARTAGDHGTTIAVPVPVPQGVRYDTTVGKEN